MRDDRAAADPPVLFGAVNLAGTFATAGGDDDDRDFRLVRGVFHARGIVGTGLKNQHFPEYAADENSCRLRSAAKMSRD